MLLSVYLERTRQILENPSAPSQLYPDTNLTSWINQARVQLAGEGKCIRGLGTIATVIDQRPYSFSSIATIGLTGIDSALNVRSIQYGVGDGMKWIYPRSWTWFNYYHMNNVVPVSGIPDTWAQLGQGVNGTFYLDPPPDAVYTLTCDVTWLPTDLEDDQDVDAIPALWSDAVPYYAAYLAYLSAQSPARQNDAARMFEFYTEFVNRARKFATPDVTPTMYPQNQDPTQISKLGLTPKAAAGGGQ